MQRAASVPLIVALFALSAAFFACTTEEGATPTCAADMGADGKNQHLADGCNPFALCVDAQGNEQEPIECCKGFTDPSERAQCLYGYGVVVTGAGGGGGSTASSTSGTGGAGGGGGN